MNVRNSSLDQALAATNIPLPPSNLRAATGEFIRYGQHNRYWLKQHDGVALFGDWVTGESHQWFEDSAAPLNAQQIAAREAKMALIQEQKTHEQIRVYEENAARAHELWMAMPQTGSSAYLERKQVAAFEVRFNNGSMVVPLRDIDGKLCSLQYIREYGDKRFLAGGKKRGCFHSIGELNDAVIVAEGYATAASIHMATGATCVVAFDAGNLEPVVHALRAKYPDMRITVAADNDCWKPDTGNVGKDKAQAVGAKYGCAVLLPTFTDTSTQPTDFNDLHRLEGLGMVREQLERALSAEPIAMSITQLAALPVLEYEKLREAQAKQQGVRVSALDKAVQDARKGTSSIKGGACTFTLVEPWPHPVDLAALLHEIVAVVRSFIICNTETATATALWCAFTWVIDHVKVAPLAVITAPEKRCGKTELLSLIGKLVRRPVFGSNISPSAIFRVIEARQPTLLIDEADTFFKDNEELRGIINSGHTRLSAYVIRNVGDHHEPTQFSTWGAKAISGIGTLSDTLMDRAIILTLRRKLPSETVQRLRHAEAGLFEDLASKLARFAADMGATIGKARPHLPDALNDRAQDNWEPLLAIADCAGGDWPKLARDTALNLLEAEQRSTSLSAELLADIHEVFDSKRIDRISSADLIKALCDDDEKSWATCNRGHLITPYQLAKRLKEYGIASKNVRIGYRTLKGFDKIQFEDAFIRYLSASTTPPQTNSGLGYTVADNVACGGTTNLPATPKPLQINDCSVVADILPPVVEHKIVEVLL